MAQYIIRAALREEENGGWVWIDGFPSRTVVKIENLETKRSVICQIRKFDENFINNYNKCDSRPYKIEINRNMIVMAGWYRDVLEIRGTTKDNIETQTAILIVRPYERWGGLRAASHHPESW